MKVEQLDKVGRYGYELHIHLTSSDIENMIEEWDSIYAAIERAEDVPVWLNTFMGLIENPRKD